MNLSLKQKTSINWFDEKCNPDKLERWFTMSYIDQQQSKNG